MNGMIRFCMVLFLATISCFSFGQSHAISSEQAAELAIHGTSTLHEWKAVAGDVQGIPTQLNLEDGHLSIDPFSIKTAVESLDGGRGPSMNSKIQKALKGTAHPHVSFVVAEAISVNVDELGEQALPINGQLTIGGETHPIELQTNISIVDDNIHISGMRKLKMTTFNIEPPSAMFGQIKTNDDITIRFDVHYIVN